MKNTIFLLFLFATSLSAQDVTKDSIAVVSIGGGMVQATHYLEYSNGAKVTTVSAPETAVNYANAKQADWTRKSLRMGSDARLILTFQKALTELERENTDVKALTGISPLDTIQAALVAPLLESGWKIRVDTASTDIVFSVNASGQLRHKVGAATTRNATMYHEFLVLKNYPTTLTNMVFVKKANGNYSDFSGRYIIRKPGATSNSIQPALQPAPKESETPTVEQPQEVDKNGNVIKSKSKKKSKKKQ